MVTDTELWQVDKGRQARLDAGLEERGETTVSERIGWLIGAGVFRIPTVEVVIEVVDKDDDGNPVDLPISNPTPEQAARKRGRIALVLDQEGAEFYIELLHSYNARGSVRDVAVYDDENYLRKECELMYGKNSDEET